MENTEKQPIEKPVEQPIDPAVETANKDLTSNFMSQIKTL